MSTRPKHILVIDDEIDIREVAKLSLQVMMDWTVTAVSSGAAGIKAAIANPPDAVLLDVMMPEMNGFVTRQHLAQHPKTWDIPVIFLTAKLQFQNHRHYTDLNAAAILHKPFDPTELGHQISQAAGWSKPTEPDNLVHLPTSTSALALGV
jgi:CheY-like chemotaxis protein